MSCNNLVSLMCRRAEKQKAVDVRIGLINTCVLLDDGRCGVASTMYDNSAECCKLLEEGGELKGKSAEELLHFYPSRNPVKAAIGLATVNALANYEINNKREGDILKIIDISPNDRVGMIGYFKPTVKEIEKVTDNIAVFEKRKIEEKYILPEEKMSEVLPLCTVVLITSTTLVNKTFEAIVKFIGNARLCVMLGPSTPLVPEFFIDKNIRILSGVEILNTEKILEVTSQVGGMTKFKKFVRKINLVY